MTMALPFAISFAIGAAATVGVLRLSAQSQVKPTAEPALAFEVASIKPARPGVPLGLAQHFILQPGGRLRAIGITAEGLIVSAFSIKPSQLVGGPTWLSTAQFEIEAKTSTTSTVEPRWDQLPAMLRTLLADRFKLKSHMERRPVTVYALVTARRDGRLGPRLRRSDPGCGDLNDDAPPCAWSGDQGTLSARGITMTTLAGFLGRTGVTAIVLDKTELAGRFDVDLKWSTDAGRPGAIISADVASPLGANQPAGAASTPDAPSLFTAVQEQLGLKLQARREPVDVVVVDHIERPTPN